MITKCLPVRNKSANLSDHSSPDDGQNSNVRSDFKTARGNPAKSPRIANGVSDDELGSTRGGKWAK